MRIKSSHIDEVMPVSQADSTIQCHISKNKSYGLGHVLPAALESVGHTQLVLGKGVRAGRKGEMRRGHSDRWEIKNKGAVFQCQPGTVPKAVILPSELRATLASSFPEVCEPRYVSLQVCSALWLAGCLSSLLLPVELCLLGTDHPALPSQPSLRPPP